MRDPNSDLPIVEQFGRARHGAPIAEHDFDRLAVPDAPGRGQDGR
jgi:hypothetical protein